MYVVGTEENHLIEMVLFSTQNMLCLHMSYSLMIDLSAMKHYDTGYINMWCTLLKTLPLKCSKG